MTNDTLYQIVPRADMEAVLNGTLDGGQSYTLDEAFREAGRICGRSPAEVRRWWGTRDRVTRRLFVAGPRYIPGRGVIIMPAAKGVPVARPNQLSLNI